MCFNSGSETKLRNLTDKSIDVQIRVGSILVKYYKLHPGCTKTLRSSRIYSHYAPRGRATFFYDDSCEPYVWRHNSAASWTSAKQRYIGLDELKICREMRIWRDTFEGTFSVLRSSTE